MKGLEPSTFCMASVLREHRAIQGRMETTLAAGAVPVSSPSFASSLPLRYQRGAGVSDPLDLEDVEDNQVSAVTRLVTFVDLREGVGDARQLSVSARHEAELPDGRRVLLLDDRGWSASSLIAWGEGEVPEEQPDSWATMSVEDIEETTRIVVGPDEPFEGSSQEDAEEGHWAYLSDVLRQHGVVVDALDLRRLPHDVVLSERLLARVGRSAKA
jgi:hypothetical protein